MMKGCMGIIGILLVFFLGIILFTPTKTGIKTKTWQVQTKENEEWLGTWSIESIGGKPIGQYMADRGSFDIFISWNWTFYSDGTFNSSLHQDTGQGIITTRISGTYKIDGDRYETKQTEAIMSMNAASVPILTGTLSQTGRWYRIGDTLTLNGFSEKVFKR